LKHGEGSLRVGDDEFIGKYQHDQFTGKGKHFRMGQPFYEGEFKSGKRHGFGKMIDYQH